MKLTEMVKRILIDDSLRLQSGNIAETYIEYPDSQPDQLKIDDVDVLAMELTYAPIRGVQGLRLVEEEVLPNGTRRVTQEFNLAPDTAYSLFSFWRQLDKESGLS